MISQILATKLFIPPPRSEYVLRQRLFDLLNQVTERKLTLISAPAGYGKTTLLSAWVDQVDRPIAWLSLDEEDNDITRFFDYLIAALQTVAPGIGREIPTLRGTSELAYPQALLIPLINEIANNQDTLFILDDYHAIHEEGVHQTVAFLLDNLPPNLHLIITSRTDPPIPIARLRAKGDLCEVRARDLRFTAAEAVDFFNTSLGLDLVSADIETLVKKTEGWVTGLQLAAISLQTHPDRQAFIQTFAGDDRHIVDYLLEEVLRSQPENIHAFLLETSILDRLCASLCQAVTGRDDSPAILSTLEKTNIFLIPLDNRRQWYRYHQLFRELLHLQLKRENTSQMPLLHIRASAWFESEDFLNQAITHAVEAGDIKRLERLVQAHTLGMLEIGETMTVDRWLSVLPEDTIRSSLWLTVARGWTLMLSGKIDAAETILENLKVLASDPEVDEGQMKRALGQIAALRAYIADLMGDPARTEAYALEALDRLAEDDHLAIAMASMMLATSYFRRGDTARAEAALQYALITSETRPYSFVVIDSLCMLSKIHYLNGQLHESAAMLKRALDISKENMDRGNRQFPITGLAYIYQSQLLCEWNQLGEALNNVKQGLEMLEPFGYTDCVIVGLLNMASIYHALGIEEQALEAVGRAKQIARRIPYWYVRTAAVEIWLRTLQDDSLVVAEWPKELTDILSREPEIHQGMVYRYLAKALIALGNAREAADLLQKVRHITEKDGAKDRLIRVLILQAAALFLLDEENEALVCLQNAIELAEPGGYVRIFLDEGEPVARLIYRAAQQGIHTDYCLKLLDEFSTHTPSTQSIPDGTGDLVEPLSDREIEVLTHIASGSTNQEIAGKLYLSLSTVKSHASNIFSKLGVKNRTEAVARARLLGLLDKE